MRKAIFAQQNKSPSRELSVAAPTGGWNVISPISRMPPEDALFMDDMWPTPVDVQLRKGFVSHGNTPVDDPGAADPHDIRSIMSYTAPGDNTLFVGDQSGIYDATAGGSLSSVSSAATFGGWESTNIATSGGNFLWCCNGVDKSRYFDGSSWTVLDGASSPALTGVTSSDIKNVTLFKTRLMFLLNDSLSFGFLPVNSVAGAVSTFPLGAIFQKGGYLTNFEGWSIDGGDGIDDYFVFITSEGEAAIYQGTDPAVAANWALVGVYNLGRPLSGRCTVKLGGDVIYLSVQGVYPLSKALGFATSDETAAISYKIQPAIQAFTALSPDLYGWQIEFFPAATMLLINVPFKSNDSLNLIYSYQFVMNTTNKSWARFTNMAAEAWGLHENKLYFARHNLLFEAWTGGSDDGAATIGTTKQSFNTLRKPSREKHVKMIRPLVEITKSITMSLGFDTDFSVDTLLYVQPDIAANISRWDSARFDQNSWAGAVISTEWRTVPNDPGRWFSLNMKIEGTDSEVSWYATDYILQDGNIFG